MKEAITAATFSYEGLDVIDIKTSDYGDIFITAKTNQKPVSCPCCGTAGDYSESGTRSINCFDVPSGGSHVKLEIAIQKYRCGKCGQDGLEAPLTAIDGKHLITTKLLENIREEKSNPNHSEIALRFGVDENTVRDIFLEYCDDVTAHWFVYD